MSKTIYRVVRGCTFCNTCAYECPVAAIEMTDRGAEIDEDRCTGCGSCYDNCASEAIKPIRPEDGKNEPMQ